MSCRCPRSELLSDESDVSLLVVESVAVSWVCRPVPDPVDELPPVSLTIAFGTNCCLNGLRLGDPSSRSW